MVFLEPSTRTRSSFEVSAYKLGLQALCPEFGSSSSLSKGESEVDTLKNISALDPDLMIVRYSGSEAVDTYLEESEIPIVNAGSGKAAHPTQALLDAFTIKEELGTLKNQKVLIVGDIENGRVARSNIQLLSTMGAEVALCGPEPFMPKEFSHLQKMSLEEGLSWANVVMSLRIQLERHTNKIEMTGEEYHKAFGINEEKMKVFGAGILMHPGPINHGVELSSGVLKDPRCRVLTQVKNGVYIRAAILSQILGIEI